jgi:hypothetical protein
MCITYQAAVGVVAKQQGRSWIWIESCTSTVVQCCVLVGSTVNACTLQLQNAYTVNTK